jgi:MFS family permease
MATDTLTLRPARARLGADWYKLWVASAISTIGDGTLVVAVPLLATTMTKDPILIAAVPVFAHLPWLFFSLHAGAIVDRFSRRTMMVLAQAAQGTLMTALALVVTFKIEQLWMLYVIAFGIATAQTVFGTASQTIVPRIVANAGLEKANGWLYATELIGEDSLGPAVGAALVVGGLAMPLWLDAVTFFVSLILIRLLRTHGRAESTVPRRALRVEIVEGVRWLRRHRLLRTLTMVAAASNLCQNMFLGTLILFAQRELHVTGSGYGILLTTMAAGGVLGGLFSDRLVRLFDARRLALAMQVVLPVAWLSIGLFGRNLVTVGILASIAALATTMWNVVVTSLRQRLVPDELRGRVNGVGRLVAFGTIPLGYLIGGVIATLWGVVVPWIVAGGVRLIVSLWAFPAISKWHTAHPSTTPTPPPVDPGVSCSLDGVSSE